MLVFGKKFLETRLKLYAFKKLLKLWGNFHHYSNFSLGLVELHFILHTKLADVYLSCPFVHLDRTDMLPFCIKLYPKVTFMAISIFFCHLCIFMQYKVFQLTHLQRLLPKNNYALNVNNLYKILDLYWTVTIRAAPWAVLKKKGHKMLAVQMYWSICKHFVNK